MDDIYVSGTFDLSMVLDRTEQEAVKLLTDAKRVFRVASRDGKALKGVSELNASRVNLHVVEGVVSSYTLG